MKFNIPLNRPARICFNTRPKFNEMVNQPVLDGEGQQVYEDDWMDCPTVVAMVAEELQARIEKLEEAVKVMGTTETLIQTLETVATHKRKPEPPEGVPLSKIRKKREAKKP